MVSARVCVELMLLLDMKKHSKCKLFLLVTENFPIIIPRIIEYIRDNLKLNNPPTMELIIVSYT